MASEDALVYILDGNTLVGLALQESDATRKSPTRVELELVRIFKEHEELKTRQRVWGRDQIFHYCTKEIKPYPRLLCSVCRTPIDGSTDFNAYEKIKELYAKIPNSTS